MARVQAALTSAQWTEQIFVQTPVLDRTPGRKLGWNQPHFSRYNRPYFIRNRYKNSAWKSELFMHTIESGRKWQRVFVASSRRDLTCDNNTYPMRKVFCFFLLMNSGIDINYQCRSVKHTEMLGYVWWTWWIFLMHFYKTDS